MSKGNSMRTLRDVLVQMKGIWSRLDGGQKLVVAAVLFATMAGLGGIAWFAGRPGFEPVTPANGNGSTRVGQAIAAAQSEDAPTSESKLDATARAQAVAAIASLDGVIAVNVTAGGRRRTAAAFEGQDEVRASAVLRLAPGVPFEPVARSAASLAAAQLMVPLQNIEILSASGNQRWRYDPDRETGTDSAEFLRLQSSLGEERTRLAQRRLDQLWPGKTSVAVNVELDPTWETRSEKVLPEEAIVKSETRDTTDSSSGSTAAGEQRSTNKTQKREREFVTDIGERRTGKMAPEVKRLTVAVLYDRSLEHAPRFDKQDLVNAVKAIVGWDPARDQPEAFSTLAGDFASSEGAAMAAAAPGIAEVMLQWGPTIGPVLGLLVVVMFLRGLFHRSRPQAAAAGAVAATAVKLEDMSPDEQQQHMRREIERSIANDPKALARLFESWLGEQKA
jgi:flagellar biosynthesis/type III secretory pathway M-ring protein FliF/YscJ